MAAGVAAHDGIAHAQRAALHNQLGDDAAAFVQFGFQAGANGFAIRIGLELLVVGDEQQHFQQFVDARPG